MSIIPETPHPPASGPVVEQSRVGFSGDDFFNVHSSFAVVLECPTPAGGAKEGPNRGPGRRGDPGAVGATSELLS